MKPIPEYLLQPCDIILVEGTGLISRGIKWFTNSKWSHVAIYVGGGKQSIIEAAMDGVEINGVQSMVAGHSRCQIRRYPGLTVEDATVIKNAAYSMLYRPYDKVQLLTLGVYELLRKVGIRWSALVRNNRTKLICSEVVAVAFAAARIKFDAKEKMVTPDDLGDTKMLTTVYDSANP